MTNRSVRPQIHARLRRRAGVGGRAMRSWRCELEQNAPADLVGILVAPIAEDHDAELPVRHHPDIGRCIVESAVLLDDGGPFPGDDLPGQRLPVVRADTQDAAVRQRHRLAQRPLERRIAEIGGEKERHVARGGIHLTRPRPMVIAGLIAGRADRLAFVAVALRGAAPELGGQASVRAVVAARQDRRGHAQRPQQALLDQLVDGRAVGTLERELQHDETRMGIKMLLAGAFSAFQALSVRMNSGSV